MQNNNRDIATAKSDEDTAAWNLEYLTGRTVISMTEFCDFDWLIAKSVKGNRVATAIAEYRKRDNPKHQYPTIVFNKAKLDNYLVMTEALKIPDVIFVVQWNDRVELEWARMRDLAEYEVTTMTRAIEERCNDRAQAVYNVPVTDFKPFK